MARLIARRLLSAIPLAAFVLTLGFLLLEAAPGRPVDLLLGDAPVPPGVRARIEAAYGLDRPALARYGAWWAGVLHGDLGWSISRGRTVRSVLAAALPATAGLSGAALLIQLVAGVALGAVRSVRANGLVDRLAGAASLALSAAPPFWLALMAILLLSVRVPVFPPSSAHTIGSEAWSPFARAADALWHVALPALVLGLGAAGAIGQFLRAGVLRTLDESFVRAARARGASPRRILFVHALAASAGPVITLAGLQLPSLVSGALIVEVVFGWPGMGRVSYDAVMAQDVPLVLAALLPATLLVVAGGLASDLAIAAIDPRVRLGPDTGA